MLYQKKHRKDLLHDQYIESFERAGYFCIDLHQLGNGVPDLQVIARSGIAVMLEIKSPGKKLRKEQVEFFKIYPAPIHLVYSIRDARRIIQFYDHQKPITLWRPKCP